MTITQAVIMGVLQGLTEFLPVSSSGHLALSRELLGAGPAEDVGFEVAVHAGTLLAVLIYYKTRIVTIFTESWRGDGDGRRWLIWLVVGTIPAGIIGILAKDHVAILFNDITLVGIAWLFTALLLFLSERLFHEKTDAGNMGIWRAIAIGFAQAAALIPGISRSGATIGTGLLTGVNRKSAVDFAFILSLPSVGGATLLTIPDWIDQSVGLGPEHLIGALAALVSGYLTITLMLRIVAGGKLHWFAAYCAILGVVALFL